MSVEVRPDQGMRFPERWLAVLRIAVGVWFLKALWTKVGITLAWGVLPVPTASERWIQTMPLLVARYADGNPLVFFREFLQNTVIPHPVLFAHLTAFGEVAIGLGLTFGFLTSLAAAVGLVLVVTYGLATQWMTPNQQGFHFLLAVCMTAFFAGRAGRQWGLDGWLRVNRPGSLWARLPLG